MDHFAKSQNLLLNDLFWSKQSIYIHYMKRLLRIAFGLPLSPFPMLLATYIWMWDDTGESWINSVGKFTWYLASGQWDKLPE